MDSLSKRGESIDRISNLPNNLISHIISFLSTKDAVRTSVLSKQWIHQWTSITHLDFDDDHTMRIENTTATQFSFVHFVYRVLLFKVNPLDSFRLKCSRNYGGVIHVHAWLSAALARHVREIDLTVPNNDLCLPPPPWSSLEINCLFSSTTLVVLKLGRGFFIRVPDIISLESLKILHLSSIEFGDNEILPRLLLSCPLLEEFKMQGKLSEDMDLRIINIESLVLKRLILSGLYSGQYYLLLNSPSLEYLELVDKGLPDSYHLEMETLHFLDRAHLCLSLADEQYDQEDDDLVLAKSIADLAVAISNVRILYLSESAFSALYYPDYITDFELPKFPRLTDLKIGAIAAQDEGFLLLITFLENSPQLESLSFALERLILDEDWGSPRVVPFCMQHNLKVIEINLFSGRSAELGMIKFFLKKTIGLEELRLPKVKERILTEELGDVINEVLMLPKASKSCKIVLT